MSLIDKAREISKLKYKYESLQMSLNSIKKLTSIEFFDHYSHRIPEEFQNKLRDFVKSDLQNEANQIERKLKKLIKE